VEPIEFGKYLLLQQIGTGRIGQVWKTKVLGVKGLEKFLGIKRLHPHLNTQKPMPKLFVDKFYKKKEEAPVLFGPKK